MTGLVLRALGSRFGTKRVYLAGLAAGVLAMVLLIVSSFLTSDKAVAYGLLLAAMASLGAGFGLAVPALNTFAAAFHPTAVDRSILVLNALLGLGTVLAPVCVALPLDCELPRSGQLPEADPRQVPAAGPPDLRPRSVILTELGQTF